MPQATIGGAKTRQKDVQPVEGAGFDRRSRVLRERNVLDAPPMTGRHAAQIGGTDRGIAELVRRHERHLKNIRKHLLPARVRAAAAGQEHPIGRKAYAAQGIPTIAYGERNAFEDRSDELAAGATEAQIGPGGGGVRIEQRCALSRHIGQEDRAAISFALVEAGAVHLRPGSAKHHARPLEHRAPFCRAAIE